jgi:hypothetical protein
MIEFYLQLNKEKDSSRWLKWLNHRTEISNLVSKTLTYVDNRENVIIFGAGNCDDLNLSYFTDQFRYVWLADVDLLSMNEALKNLESSLISHLQLVPTDFTKLDQIDFYDRFKIMLTEKANVEQVILFLKHSGQQIAQIELLPHLKSSFQVVISSAVYTQLFYIQALSMFAEHIKNYNKEEIADIISALLELRTQIITEYNDLLISLLAPSGRIIVWTDVSKIDSNGAFNETIYALPTESERLKYIMSEVKDNGREDALYGLEDMQKRFRTENRMFQHWIWPYSEKNHCITFGISGRIN